MKYQKLCDVLGPLSDNFSQALDSNQQWSDECAKWGPPFYIYALWRGPHFWFTRFKKNYV